LLLLMFFLAGGAARHESVTIDEVAHIGAGLVTSRSWICDSMTNIRRWSRY